MEFYKKSGFLKLFGSLSILMLSLVLVFSCTDQAKAKPYFVHKESRKDGIVAKIGDEEITEDVLVGSDKMDFFDLKKKEYDLKMDRLNKLLVERLVGAEAKNAGMSLDEFIDKKITKGEIKISDKDYKAFVEEKRIPQQQIDSNPSLKDRIVFYLKNLKRQELLMARVSDLTRKKPVEVYFSKPKMEVKVEVGSAPFFGKQGAPVTIVEFSDFQCPFCSKAADTVGQIKKKYGSKVQFAFRHFPLPMHSLAKKASEASMCARDQGGDSSFWKYHDLAFKNQEKLDEPSLQKYAQQMGLDSKKFNQCLESGQYTAYVEEDMKYAEKVGVRSTPVFFINGQIVNGALPIESFSELIDEELSSKN